MTPKREKEIRDSLNSGTAWESDLRACLAEIDRLRAELVDMRLEYPHVIERGTLTGLVQLRQVIDEKVATAIDVLEKIQFQSVITPETGPLINWAREAITKIRDMK